METLFPGSSRAPRRLRAHLAEIQAARIMLTHMSPDMPGRLGEAELPAAYDGMVIDL